MSNARQAELEISIQFLLERYEFDLVHGIITNKRSRKRADQFHHFRQQSFSNTRYRQVQVYWKGAIVKIAAHRMLWAVANGRWPADGMVIDHINSDTDDNCISNLEEISIADNARRINQRDN